MVVIPFREGLPKRGLSVPVLEEEIDSFECVLQHCLYYNYELIKK